MEDGEHGLHGNKSELGLGRGARRRRLEVG